MSIFPPQGGLESGKSGSLVVTSSQTLQGSNVYTEVYITNNATLTLAPGASLVTSHLVIDQNATLQLQGATVTIDTLVSEGTISSTSSSDQITVNIGSKLGGSISLAGTMILQQIGNVINHILFGSVSGSGKVEVNGIASIETNITLSVASVTGAGTLSIASGYTLTIGGNVTLGVASVTGAGTLNIASGYTLIVENTSISSSILFSGSGTLEIGSGVTGGSVSTTTTYWGFFVNGITKLPLGSLTAQALLLFSPNAFSGGSAGSAPLPASTYYITIASGSSLTITSASPMNFAVVSTSSSYSVNTGTVTVDGFTCCEVNKSSSASGAISVTGAASCSGFTF